MLAVIERGLIAQAQQCPDNWGPLYGRVLDGDVYRIDSLGPSPAVGQAGGTAVGVWARTQAAAPTTGAAGPVMLLLADDKEHFLALPAGSPAVEIRAIIIDVGDDLFRRLGGVVDTNKLQNVTVAIGGCGSLGSHAALLLATTGVANFTLADPDRLETHNVIRHLCGVSDIGRLKVHAVADRLRDKNPHVQIETMPLAIDLDAEAFAQAVGRADLVIGATDDPRAQLAINRMAVAAGKPALYVGAYNAGFGGEVIRVVPGKTACLRCTYDATADLFDRAEPGDEGQTGAYDADRGHPAMWIDVGIIAHLLGRMGIETVLGLSDPVQNLVGDYLLWGNRRQWVFQRPLESHWLSIPRSPQCFVCGAQSSATDAAEHGPESAGAAARAASILAKARGHHPDE